MLDVMKRNNHMPTYEVFLDLVQASAKDPDWYCVVLSFSV